MTLVISNLSVTIGGHEVVSINSLAVERGQRVGIVGESGSGKSMTVMSLVGLQPFEATVRGSIRLGAEELVGRSDRALADIRGARIGTVFQDPVRSLNPVTRVGRQVGEVLRLHTSLSAAAVRSRVVDLLGRVRLPNPAEIATRYPHQLSGGQAQRIVIAMAIAMDPELLIADEPTTALDVTVQEEILDLLRELSERCNMGLIFVSHDLGVVRAVCHDVAVMYGGKVVESGRVADVIYHPRHRYTHALVSASPRGVAGGLDGESGDLFATIPGTVPSIGRFPSGCPFRGRCDHEVRQCADRLRTTAVTAEHRHTCANPVSYSEVGRVSD